MQTHQTAAQAPLLRVAGRGAAYLPPEVAAAHVELKALVPPPRPADMLPDYPGAENNQARTYRLLGLAPDYAQDLRRFASSADAQEEFPTASTLRFYLLNRLSGSFVSDHLRYLSSVAQAAPMLEPAKAQIFRKAIVFELEQLHGYIQFFEAYRNTPFVRSASPKTVLSIGMIAAAGGTFTSARTSQREKMADYFLEYLKKIPLDQLQRAIECGVRQHKLHSWVLSILSEYHKTDLSKL